MFMSFLRAAATAAANILDDQQWTYLPVYTQSSLTWPLHEIIIVDTATTRPRLNSFLAGTNGAKAPHSPR
jgi:hypothetical protein